MTASTSQAVLVVNIRPNPCGVAGHDRRRTPCGRERGEQRVKPTDTGVAKPGALLGVSVALDDRVVDIEQRVPAAVGGDRVQTDVADYGHAHGHLEQPGEAGQRIRNRDAIASQLPDVTERERPQE